MNLIQKSAKGDKAESLLNNEIFRESITNLRQAITQKWQSCDVKDKESAHELLIMIKLIDGLEQNIKSFVVDGKKAKFEIEQHRKQEESKKRFKFF